MRLFIAIALDDAVQRELRSARDKLRAELSGAKIGWTRDENFHITVKFLGEVPDTDVHPLCQLLKSEPLGAPFTLRLEGIGSLPPRGRPRVIVATLGGDAEAASALSSHIDQICKQFGVLLERRKFLPHVTLGRLRQSLSIDLPKVSMALLPVVVKSIHLMRSDPGPEGSVYCRLAKFDLQRK